MRKLLKELGPLVLTAALAVWLIWSSTDTCDYCHRRVFFWQLEWISEGQITGQYCSDLCALKDAGF